MKIGYIETSVLIAMAFDDAGGAFITRSVRSFDRLYCAAIVESEFLSVAKRQGVVEEASSFLKPVRFVYPNHSLTSQAGQVLDCAQVDGISLHHLATALYLFPKTEQVYYLTLDEKQKKVADELGFKCEFL